MIQGFSEIYEDAVALLEDLCTPEGILASTIEADNYKRIWARDSIVCGLAGLKIGNDTVIEGLKNSLLTLADHQNDLGMIPSNVLPKENDVSYGSLVGRIDANTWFVLGCCMYYQETKDESTWHILRPKVEKCLSFLKATEFNNKGWLYTPLSGNWADEYPVHGYTLYDNMLRLWGENLWNTIAGKEPLDSDRAFQNFWPSHETEEGHVYHKTAFQQLDPDSILHFIAFMLPGKYDTRFDAAGNALALLQTRLNAHQKEKISQFIDTLTSEIGSALIPAFWPMITEKSEDWNLLEGNYSFSFKNHPGAFHNGGIWPVWMGLFCWGLAKNGMHGEVKNIISTFVDVVREKPDWNFQEYIHGKTLALGGKTQMGYTASGIVFMKLALHLSE
ncbi:glycoside hydrolase 100 family protein [Aureisphaera galaxeae]|uniref:glycoside hydrolase 100 family protein n=1 Tax=Aureisphaera galaxeae TaxID=1538023 RepID=UPI00235043AB|nr:glycoside hydrolase 100 family protein [Aureisphaera galaxeae]MDC8002996.1 glycoside hydrolase 100 family protein [Aureisphaera galaxeae]